MAPLSKQDHFYVPECEKETAGEQMTGDFDSTVNTSHSTIGEDHSVLDSDLDLSQDISHSVSRTGGGDSVMDATTDLSQSGQFEIHGERSSVTFPSRMETSRASQESHRSRSDSEDENAVASDASTSSFEVVKSEKEEL